MTRTEREGLFFVLLAAFGYAFLPIVTKNIFNISDFEPLDIATWRFIFATPLIWVLFLIRKVPPSEIPLPRKQLIGMGMFFSLAALSVALGVERIPASTYIVIFYSYPMMIALISVIFLKERFSIILWIAMILSLLGIILTVPDFANIGRDSWIGILIALVNALVAAVYFLISKRVLSGFDVSHITQGTAWVISGALLVFISVSFIRGLAIPQNSEAWFNILFMAMVGTIVPMAAINVGIQKLGAARTSIIATIEPLIGMILAVIFLSEEILAIQWLGGGLIITSILLLQNRKFKFMKSKRKIAGNMDII